MAVALKAAQGFFFRVLTGQATAHLIPNGYGVSICGIDLYCRLNQAPGGSERVCQSCTRELKRRLGGRGT